jgi:type I restriction enzyme S subunit
MPKKLAKGWVRTTLGDVCAINPRMGFDEPPPDTTEVSFVPMAAVEEETGRLDASQVRALGSVRKGYTSFAEKDVIFAKITPCMENGKIALATELKNGLGYGSTEFFVFRPYEGLLPRFVLYFLLQPSFREAAERQMSGASGQKRVPSHFLSAHEFSLPPTREQERIVAKLDATLSKLELAESVARRAQDRLKRYRAAVLHAAVTGKLTDTWRKTHQKRVQSESGKTLANRLLTAHRARWEDAELQRLRAAGKEPKDDKWKSSYVAPVGPNPEPQVTLPNGWCWMSLNQLTSHMTSGSRDWSQYYNRGSGTFLMAQNIRRSGLDLSFRQAIDPPHDDRERKRSQVAKDDILVTIVGANTGDVCVVPRELPEHFVCQSVALMRLAEPALSQFVWFSLASDNDGQDQWRNMIYGAGRPHLGFKHLRATVVAVAPLIEQRQIVTEVNRRLAAVERLTATLEQQLVRVSATRRSLLVEAFAGRLVPQDPQDEHASVLLDRIQAIREAKANKPKGKRMKKSQSKAEIARRPLADVLREHKKPMTPEDLFRTSGFEVAQVDDFYRELTLLRDKLLEQKPKASEAKLWPSRAHVLLQLKKGAAK